MIALPDHAHATACENPAIVMSPSLRAMNPLRRLLGTLPLVDRTLAVPLPVQTCITAHTTLA